MRPHHAHLSHPKYRPDIDGLRAIAVLSVVAFHTFPNWITGGFIGVDVFFVISGYLITTIIFENLDRGTFSFSEFYARRIRRIVPALLLVLAASYAFGWFALLADEYKRLGKHIAGGVALIPNFIFWHEADYFDNSAGTKPLLHLWSLGIEEQFYIVWPLLAWLAWRRNFNILTIMILIAIVSFYLNLDGIEKDAVATFYSPQTRFWELLCGSSLAWMMLYGKSAFSTVKVRLDAWLAFPPYWDKRQADGTTLSNALSFVGLLLLTCGFWHINKEFGFPGKWAVVPVLGAVLIIIAGPRAWLNRIFLSNKVAIWFGLISYPLYLWHWPLLSFARVVESEMPGRNIRITAVVLSVVLAWLTYRLVECPVRLGQHNWCKVGILLVLMFTIGYVGYNTYKRDGLAFRFPAEIRFLTQNIDFDWKGYIRWEKCHLHDPALTKHDDVCFEKDRPLIGLWGDSHASSLYPGLSKLQTERKFGIMQLTHAGCGPIFNIDRSLYRKDCNLNNSVTLSNFISASPDILILHGAWSHDHYPLSNEELYVKFHATVKEIRARLPLARLVIVGPVPRWNESPQKTSFLFWKKSVDKTRDVPILQSAITLRVTEDVLFRIAEEHGVEYFSPLSELCVESFCISRVGGQPTDFIATDSAHLSKAGAEFIVKKWEPKLFGY